MTIDAFDQHEGSFEDWRQNAPAVPTGATVIVTDHALLRYLERACGFEVEAMREELAGILSAIRQSGQRSIVRDGLRFIFRGDSLATVYQNRECGSDHVNRRKDRGR